MKTEHFFVLRCCLLLLAAGAPAKESAVETSSFSVALLDCTARSIQTGRISVCSINDVTNKKICLLEKKLYYNLQWKAVSNISTFIRLSDPLRRRRRKNTWAPWPVKMVTSWLSPENKVTFKNGMNIFISFIGAGVLGLPYAFKKAGLLEGNCLNISLFGIFSQKNGVPTCDVIIWFTLFLKIRIFLWFQILICITTYWY